MNARRKAAVAIAAGSIIRLIFWLTTPVTGDAAFHYSIARYMGETWRIPTFEYVTGPDPFWYPPLFHIITAVLYRLTGILTLTPLLFGVAGLILFHIFCVRFYPKHALSATLFLAFLPFHIYYSSIGYIETLLFLITVAAFYFYFSFLKSKRTRDLAYAVFMSALAASAHYHGIVVLLSITAHLALQDRRKAAIVLAAGLILSCPWYIRNFVVFGNPVWPKVYGGYYASDATAKGTPIPVALAQLGRPGRWASVFLEFWVGAPNSGEDFASNAAVGRTRYPMFDLFMLPWLAFIVCLTLLGIWGAYLMKNDKTAIFAAIALIISVGPFVLNSLPRMFVAAMPFAVVAMAAGYDAMKFRRKDIMLAAAFIALLGGSYAYAYTYKSIRERYVPFFDMMKDKIPDDAKVVMPFNKQECVYYSERQCQRIGNTGGIPTPTIENMDRILKDYDIAYVCCSSLNWGAHDEIRIICDPFKDRKPAFEYEKGGVWGKCWKTGN